MSAMTCSVQSMGGKAFKVLLRALKKYIYSMVYVEISFVLHFNEVKLFETY